MMNHILYAVAAFQEKPAVTGDVNSGLGYVVAAYAVVWLFIFGYLYSLNRRQAKLRRDIDMMKQEEAERQSASFSSEENQPVSGRGRQVGG